MARLIYSTIASLDGYVADEAGIEPEFDSAAVARMKDESDHDLSIGGPTLAAHALAAGLVDECHLFLSPVIVGAGTRALPDGLELAWTYSTSAASATASSTCTTGC